MPIKPANRLAILPPYLFADLDRQRKEAAARGVDIIDLGVGDPDLPTPAPVVEAMVEAVRDPATHHYPSYEGMPAFRRAAADFLRRRFGVELDPDTQVCALIGSKEGIAHAPLALINPEDPVLYPSPGYPVYRVATIFAGGTPIPMPLRAENDWLPDFDAIPQSAASRATLMYLNYPNNPTGATAEPEFFAKAVAFARAHNHVLLHDAAYSEVGFDGYRAPSILQTPGAMEIAAEFHSLSKTANMTGWRIGFVAGNADIVRAIGQVKTNIDSGVFEAVQRAAITALNLPPKTYAALNETYRRRRDIVVAGLRRAGIAVKPPRATFYVWFPAPGGDSAKYARDLLARTGVVVTPGVGFGPEGEGYARIAVCRDEARLEEAMHRVALG
jgi:LL-diaminopimelate aminotransferase